MRRPIRLQISETRRSQQPQTSGAGCGCGTRGGCAGWCHGGHDGQCGSATCYNLFFWTRPDTSLERLLCYNIFTSTITCFERLLLFYSILSITFRVERLLLVTMSLHNSMANSMANFMIYCIANDHEVLVYAVRRRASSRVPVERSRRALVVESLETRKIVTTCKTIESPRSHCTSLWLRRTCRRSGSSVGVAAPRLAWHSLSHTDTLNRRPNPVAQY